MIALIDGEAQPSKLFSGSANADYRTSWSCNMRIENPLVATVTKRIDTLMGIDPSWGELLQGQRYHPGQEYRVHCDYFPPRVHYWPVMRKCGEQRVWTTMIYLCDVEEGGETEFPASVSGCRRGAGRCSSGTICAPTAVPMARQSMRRCRSCAAPNMCSPTGSANAPGARRRSLEGRRLRDNLRHK